MDLPLAVCLWGAGQPVLGQVRATELVQEVSDTTSQGVGSQAGQLGHHLVVLEEHYAQAST